MGIGPSTKNTSLHIFRDPLVDIVDTDSDVDLLGVIVVGTSEHFVSKKLLSDRVARWAESMRPDGAIVTLDMVGNQHIDFANVIEGLEKIDIPTVGFSAVGLHGLVVSNKYMDTIVDYNKTEGHIETEIVGQNNYEEIDAKKALAFLKLKIRKREAENAKGK